MADTATLNTVNNTNEPVSSCPIGGNPAAVNQTNITQGNTVPITANVPSSGIAPSIPSVQPTSNIVDISSNPLVPKISPTYINENNRNADLQNSNQDVDDLMNSFQPSAAQNANNFTRRIYYQIFRDGDISHKWETYPTNWDSARKICATDYRRNHKRRRWHIGMCNRLFKRIVKRLVFQRQKRLSEHNSK